MNKFEIRGIVMINGSWKDVVICNEIFNSRKEARKNLKNNTVTWKYDSVMNPYISQI